MLGHFVGDVLRPRDAVFVSADGLRPEAEVHCAGQPRPVYIETYGCSR